MKVNDRYILDHFYGPSGKVNSNYSTREYIVKHYPPEVIEYLDNRYEDSNSLRETFVRIREGLEDKPKCPICGKPVHWKVGRYFSKTCGKGSCYCKIREQTIIDRYGELIFFGSTPEAIQKGIETKIRRYGTCNNHEKAKKTNLERYGVENVSSNPIIHQKILETQKQNGGIGAASSKTYEKMKQTCLERYGVDNYRKTKECVQKILDSKKKHGTVVTSKLEEDCNVWLIERYGKKDVFRQYTDKRYINPVNKHLYHCDFYIKSLDLFIEIQGHWCHGKHIFNPNNQKDVEIINQWNQKNDTYQKAIKTWTISDPIKRSVAKKSNLNFIEIFDKKITQKNLYKTIDEYVGV